MEVGVAEFLGRFVSFAGIGVLVGVAASVADGVNVGEGEKVKVRIEVAVGGGVSEPVAVLVGVVNIVAG
jgi:hypothetical protein